MSYDKDQVEILRKVYDPMNVRTWPYYVQPMPTMTWEVWDEEFNVHSSHHSLSDALNDVLIRTDILFSQGDGETGAWDGDTYTYHRESL
jgi:hypothetical protein